MKSLSDAVLSGKLKPAAVEDIRRGAYESFHLADSTAPSVFTRVMPIDDALLTRIAQGINESRYTVRRLGHDWVPEDASAIRKKDEADDNWATGEQLRPFHDACTKFCTRKYLPDATARLNVICNVIRLYDRLAALTDLRFKAVFKGGVMIRLVLMTMLRDLPLRARLKALAHMDRHKALSISDLDFEIVPFHHDPDPQLVHRFFLMDYALLLVLMHTMENEITNERQKGTGLLDTDWDEESGRGELKRELQKVADDLKDPAHPMHGVVIDHVYLTGDVPHPPRGYATKSGKSKPSDRTNAILFDCKDPEGTTRCTMDADAAFRALGVEGVPARASGGRLYATLNTYIGEGMTKERPAHRLGVFHLARIKHTFTVYYSTPAGHKRCIRLGGEMVDLSQSHGTNVDEGRRHLYEEVPEPYMRYPVLGVDAGLVTIPSYTMHGFYHDMTDQIHHGESDPWNATKLEKRIVRYAAFFFGHLMGPFVPGTSEGKLRAVRNALTSMESLDSMETPPKTTGHPEVDVLLRRERNALKHRGEEVRKPEAYLRTLRTHLNVFVECFENSIERWSPAPLTLDPVQLDTARNHVRDRRRRV